MTRLQALGAAVASQRRVAGVVYPSAVRHRAGEYSRNAAIYHAALAAPDRVEVIGHEGRVDEAWP